MGARMRRRPRWRQAPVARLASGQRFERPCVAVRRSETGRLGCPACGIRDHPTDEWMMVRGVRLVAGSEVEDAATPALVAAAAPEDFATLEPADEDEPVGGRHVEVLAVHLLVVEDERLGQTGGDGMAGIDDPDAFAFVGLAPLEVTGRAHQPPEDP